MATLFYIVGASGVGKDALMQYARTSLNGSGSVVFAHRYITRPPKSDGENHVYLSPEEFAGRRDKGLFALHWESHGLCYGIGLEIERWMEEGMDVVVNGSRQYLPCARERYPGLQAILIEADPEVIRERLTGRGRETGTEIEQRLLRKPALIQGALSIRNDGRLEEGGDALLAILIKYHQSSRT